MPTEMLLTWAVVMVAAMMHGMTGLGFGLVTVPILVLFQDARLVVVSALILSAALNVLVLLQARRHVSLKSAGPITLGSALGVPLGSYLLTVISSGALKELVALLALLFSIPLLLGYSRSFRHFRAGSLLTGAVSGALQSSTSMGSPPAVLFMANQGMPKESFRGVMVARSLAASGLALLGLLPSGLLNAEVAAYVLPLAPAMLIGYAAGTRLLRLLPQALFRRITVTVVAGTALFGLAAGLI